MKLGIDLATAFLALCATTSILVALAHWGLGGVLDGLTPHWRARVRFSALLAPFTVGALGITIALLPSIGHLMGLADDHCLTPGQHVHAHLCFIHRPTGVSWLLASIVAAAPAAILFRLGWVVLRWWNARRIFGSVIATSCPRPLEDGVYLLDSDVPLCVTVGVITPTIYISSGAIVALGAECSRAALAHERGHLARHETRVRLLGALAATFHLPRLSRSIVQGWQQDAEFVCDRFAARKAGSAALVAEALIRFQRALLRSRGASLSTEACFCVHGAPLTARVTNLLATSIDTQGDERDGIFAYGLGSVLLVIGVALQAQHLHHALESFVGVLTSAFA